MINANDSKKQKVIKILALVVVIGLVGAGVFIMQNVNHETTDDAYIEGRIHVIAPKVSGTVLKVNVVDNPSLSSFISPAVFRAGGAVVAVYTHGRDPVLSRDIKNFLKEQWDVFLSYRNRL